MRTGDVPVLFFGVLYRGSGPIPVHDLKRIRNEEGVELLDASSRMVLVESTREKAEQVVSNDPDWIVIKEKTIELPTPRPRIEKKIR